MSADRGRIFDCYLVGENSLLVRCAEILRDRGHRVLGLISSVPTIGIWAGEAGVPLLKSNAESYDFVAGQLFDYLFSVANFEILPPRLISSSRRGAINFHDGALPRYAGMHATTWAIMNGEKRHGVTWHAMTEKVDRGDILKQVLFDIDPGETALSLNAKCFEAGAVSFGQLVDELQSGTVQPRKQDANERTYYGKYERPRNAAIIDWNQEADRIDCFVRSLNFGGYRNQIGTPKMRIGDEYYIVQGVELTRDRSRPAPGTVTDLAGGHLAISTRTFNLRIDAVRTIEGKPLAPRDLIGRHGVHEGFVLGGLDGTTAERMSSVYSRVARHESHWVDQFAGYEGVLPPYARRGRSHEMQGNASFERIALSGGVIRQLSGGNHEPATAICAAFALFVGRHGGKERYTLGLSSDQVRRELAGTGTLFARQVPVAVTCDSDVAFAAAVADAAHAIEKSLAAKTFARDIFARYPELHDCEEGRGPGAYPVAVAFVDDMNAPCASDGGTLTLAVSREIAEVALVSPTGAIRQDKLRLLAAQLRTFLDDGCAHPDGKLGLVQVSTAEERERLRAISDAARKDFPSGRCIHELFEEQVARTPDACAVVCGKNTLSFRELNERANRLAHRLVGMGVCPDGLVGICLSRSVAMVTAILAVLKAGGAYVPLDPDFPESRIEYMVKDSACGAIITERRYARDFAAVSSEILAIDDEWPVISQESGQNVVSRVSPLNLAYVIYTSGSTGFPKGVMITHRNVVNFFAGMDSCIEHDGRSVWLAVTSLSFDISVLELLWTLTRGVRIVIYGGSDLRPPGHHRGARNPAGHAPGGQDESIGALIAAHEVTHLQCTPSMASMLTRDKESRERLGRLKTMLVGGEMFPVKLARTLRSAVGGDLYNMYGPTETTVWSTVHRVESAVGESVPIGLPIANTRVYVLDARLQMVPTGVTGELYIGGAGVARGYLRRPELTAERFVADPFSANGEDVLYRTGDLASFTEDGLLEYAGRADHQVKVRGYRIELGEIETRLSLHPEVREAVVAAHADPAAGTQLVAYFVPRPEHSPSERTLKEYLSAALPAYMVPAHCLPVAAFPLTPNGKIDRRALPAPTVRRGAPEIAPVASANALESRIASIWRVLLNRDQIGLDDNFFDLGGHSLLAVRMEAILRQDVGEGLTLIHVFQYPTIRSLAAFVGILSRREAAVPLAEPSKRSAIPRQRRSRTRFKG